jgi:hypothetical protein
MDYDKQLIGYILENRNIRDVIQTGISADMLSAEARVYWEFLNAHYSKYQEVPSKMYFVDNFPGYVHDPPKDKLEALVYNIKSILLGKELSAISAETAEMAFVDPWEARRRFLARASDVASRHQIEDTDLIAGDNKLEVQGVIQRIKDTGGVIGIPWPWDVFNRHTPGIDINHFVYMYGPEKSKKSWLMVFLTAFFEDLGYRVAVHTREMTRLEFSMRLYALRAQLDYGEAITQGKITPAEERLLDQAMEGFERRRRILFTEVGEGMAGIQSKNEQFRPNIIIHDYMKALADDAMTGKDTRAGQEWSYVMKAVDGLATYAKTAKVPIIAVGHTNGDESKLAGRSTQDAAHSKHIARRVDYMIRIVNDPFHNRMGLILVAGRCAPQFLGVTINGHICKGFGETIEENAEWVRDFDIVKGGEEDAKTRKTEVQTTGVRSSISASSFASNARKT